MDELDKKIPADTWRKLFDEATEAPPPRVWDTIEQQLDGEENAGIVPLWGKGIASTRPLLWGTGIAAALALLLVGWWAMPTSVDKNQSRTVHQPPVALNPVVAPQAAVAKNPTVRERLERSLRPTTRMASVGTLTGRKSHKAVYREFESSSAWLPDALAAQRVLAEVARLQTSEAQSSVLQTVSRVATANSLVQMASVTQSDETSLNTPESEQLKTLSVKPIRLHEFGHIYRIVWFRPSETAAQPDGVTSKRRGHDHWISAGVTPGAFNPMVSVQLSSLANAYIAKSAPLVNNAYQAPSVSSRANFSMAYQVTAGMLLNERWSVETGVGLLAGRSTVDSPATYSASVVTDLKNNAGNLYVDALRNSVAGMGPGQVHFANSPTQIASTSYTNQTRRTLTNDYTFAQVPVQLGYQLRPRKRLSLALLGGFISNIFVRNAVDNEVLITAKDGVYQPVSFAALMGARFRYKPSPQWSASLAGIYQPSIGLVTQAHSQVQSQPNTAGMTLSVDYHF